MHSLLLRRAAVASLLGAPLLLVAAAASAEDDTIEEVVVTAHPLSGDGLSEPAIVLEGTELDSEVAASIGDTVSRQAGIHSASFGYAVGRPVVHGMGGPRVRVMEDRIDAMDASVSSADHAVTIEPFLAERIEVVKGPSTLLYGSGAIGGVVNVDTGRISRQAIDGFDGKVSVRATDNADGTNATLRLGAGNGTFAWHVDGFTRSAEDYDIPGFAESAGLRAIEEQDEHEEEEEHEEEHEGEEEHEEHEDEEAYGTLPGSHSDGSGGAIGFSWVGDRGFVSMAASRLNYDYGLPGASHVHEEHHEDEDEHHDEGHEGRRRAPRRGRRRPRRGRRRASRRGSGRHADPGTRADAARRRSRHQRSLRALLRPQRPRRAQRLRPYRDRTERRGWHPLRHRVL